jgi:ABC-type anion transport system duplicated permease subunit
VALVLVSLLLQPSWPREWLNAVSQAPHIAPLIGQTAVGPLVLLSLMRWRRADARLLVALAWTVPVGVAIGTNRKFASIMQPVVQVTASVPATATSPPNVMDLNGTISKWTFRLIHPTPAGFKNHHSIPILA